MKRIKRKILYKEFKEKGSDFAKVLSTTDISGPTTRRGKYRNFLSSGHWKALRSKKLRKHGACFICLSRENLQIHHVSYENAFSSRQTKAIKDTRTLCKGCHNAVHLIQKERGVGYEATEGIIQELKRHAQEARQEVREIKDGFNEMVRNF